jgi:hypothetical protein
VFLIPEELGQVVFGPASLQLSPHAFDDPAMTLNGDSVGMTRANRVPHPPNGARVIPIFELIVLSFGSRYSINL